LKKITHKIVGITLAAGLIFPAAADMHKSPEKAGAHSIYEDVYSVSALHPLRYSSINAGTFENVSFSSPTVINYSVIDKSGITEFVNDCIFENSVLIASDARIANGHINYQNYDQKFNIYGDLEIHDALDYYIGPESETDLKERPELVCCGNIDFGEIINRYGRNGKGYSSGGTVIYDPWNWSTTIEGSSTECDERLIDLYCSSFTSRGGGMYIDANVFCSDENGTSELYSTKKFSGDLITAGSLAIDGDITVNGDLIINDSLILGPYGRLKVGGRLIIGNTIINADRYDDYQLNEIIVVSEREKVIGDRNYLEQNTEIKKLKGKEFSDISTVYDSDNYSSDGLIPSYNYVGELICEQYDTDLEYEKIRENVIGFQEIDFSRVYGSGTDYIRESAVIHGSIQNRTVYIEPSGDKDMYLVFDDSASLAASRIIVNSGNRNKVHFILGRNSFEFHNSSVLTGDYSDKIKSGCLRITADDEPIGIEFHAPRSCIVSVDESMVCGNAEYLNLSTVRTQHADCEIIYNGKKKNENDSYRSGYSPFWIGSLNFSVSDYNNFGRSLVRGDYLYISAEPAVPGADLVIFENPSDITAKEGETVRFSVDAYGFVKDYQWQFSTDGGNTWRDCTTGDPNTAELTVSAAMKRNGYQYRCIVFNNVDSFISAPAKLTVIPAVTVTSSPSSVTADEGTTAKFTVKASGNDLKYQWQYSTDDGKTWKNSTTGNPASSSLSVSAEMKRNGYKYRCKVTSGTVTVTSSAAKLTVRPSLAITGQTMGVTVTEGTTARFTVTASGNSLKYQWQYSKDGITWKNSTMGNPDTDTLSVEATAARNGYQYRCKVTSGTKTVTSSAAMLTVKTAVSVTAQPVSVTASEGTTARFKVTASGNSLKYQWQYSTDGGQTWRNSTVGDPQTSVLSVAAEAKRNGYQYRCIVSSGTSSVTSSSAKLTVKPDIQIAVQPVSRTAAEGSTVKFTVRAEGDVLGYQWYWRKPGTSEWKACSGAGFNTPELVVEAAAKRNGYEYRCEITGKSGASVKTAKVSLSVR